MSQDCYSTDVCRFIIYLLIWWDRQVTSWFDSNYSTWQNTEPLKEMSRLLAQVILLTTSIKTQAIPGDANELAPSL